MGLMLPVTGAPDAPPSFATSRETLKLDSFTLAPVSESSATSAPVTDPSAKADPFSESSFASTPFTPAPSFRSADFSELFLTSELPMVPAANAVPARAAISATTERIRAGLGLKRVTAFISSPVPGHVDVEGIQGHPGATTTGCRCKHDELLVLGAAGPEGRIRASADGPRELNAASPGTGGAVGHGGGTHGVLGGREETVPHEGHSCRPGARATGPERHHATRDVGI